LEIIKNLQHEQEIIAKMAGHPKQVVGY